MVITSQKLVLPLNIEKIETLAFGYCLRFTGLTLNENLLSIGDQAFSGCGGFEGDLVIPDKVQTIGQEAFYNCRNFNGVLFWKCCSIFRPESFCS
ncbi:MAG: leucine-rich repeat protein [Butyricimonas faecalis]